MSTNAREIDIFPADGLRNFLAFCRLPRLLYSGQEGFAAPLDADRWGLFARRLNPHFGISNYGSPVGQRTGEQIAP